MKPVVAFGKLLVSLAGLAGLRSFWYAFGMVLVSLAGLAGLASFWLLLVRFWCVWLGWLVCVRFGMLWV